LFKKAGKWPGVSGRFFRHSPHSSKMANHF
jgi:hypothetical protein